MDFSAFTQPPVPAVVVAAFMIAFVLYVYITKAINSKKTAEKADAVAPSAPAAEQSCLSVMGTPPHHASFHMHSMEVTGRQRCRLHTRTFQIIIR